MVRAVDSEALPPQVILIQNWSRNCGA
jgi:hypothetical protein